ncbi:oxidoreductase [Streptomyces sp. SID13726]|uniref:oxidoreductase n=1 Tax=Streptomyces sp. SID13726 TaxID=2706058 RepID=UPI0013B9950A|nr:oxidoreductase [Streptomyces sp. SID13726]NEA98815.1 SDR family NAD(P)-dependent oxidoreductase [Streptomyces sp. SID13726]
MAKTPPTSAWTTTRIPDQTGRLAVVTGANTGLGHETALALAEKGAHVVIAVRNLDKGRTAAALIAERVPNAALSLQELDLGSLASVRTAAKELADRHGAIDLLINNAGVSHSGKQRERTEDGFELHLGTNHLGHFALTGLLLDRLLAAPAARIVTVSSSTHRVRGADHFDDLPWDDDYRAFAAYGRSKLANLLFTYALQRRLAGTGATALAAHPGGSATELMRNTPRPVRMLSELVLQTPEMGALPTLRAATDPAALGGQFYGPDGRGQVRGYPELVTSTDRSYDLDLQQRLWNASEELTGVRYPAV